MTAGKDLYYRVHALSIEHKAEALQLIDVIDAWYHGYPKDCEKGSKDRVAGCREGFEYATVNLRAILSYSSLSLCPSIIDEYLYYSIQQFTKRIEKEKKKAIDEVMDSAAIDLASEICGMPFSVAMMHPGTIEDKMKAELGHGDDHVQRKRKWEEMTESVTKMSEICKRVKFD